MSILSSDVILEVVFFDDYNSMIIDNVLEGESEKEVEEDTKEESKLNVKYLIDYPEVRNHEMQSNIYSYFQLSGPHIEHFSPPPDRY